MLRIQQTLDSDNRNNQTLIFIIYFLLNVLCKTVLKLKKKILAFG